ncbi:MAG TPA: glycosyl transferase, partial [Mobilitalea sp.]|nr:glycosyl transferase [Mobilitalea sp.]
MDAGSALKLLRMEELGQNLEFFNGFGGFVEEGKEYEILLDGSKPPAPWINVIANKNFGFFVSETGAGFTWANNSRENKITPWSNDPVSDRASEAIYIFDEITGEVMTPMSLGKTDHGIYQVRHGFGYTKFLHEEDNLDQELSVFTPLDEPVKLWNLKLTNQSDNVKYLSLTYYVEWVLGTNREQTSPYIVTNYSNEHEYLSAKNIYTFNFGNSSAFQFSSDMINSYTGDRQEFLGLKGSVLHPQGVEAKLSNHTGACYDSCGVIRVSVAVNPKESKTVVFGLGMSSDTKEIHTLRHKYQDTRMAENELNKVKTYWDKMLGTIRVRT